MMNPSTAQPRDPALVPSWKSSERRRVGLIYSYRMRNHFYPKDKKTYLHSGTKCSAPKKCHPERLDRILKIWNELHSSGIAQRCTVMDGKEAADEHIKLVHTKKHVDFFRNISSPDEGFREKMAKKYNSIYFNEGSSEATYLSAGSAIETDLGIEKVLIVDWDVHHGNGTQKIFWKDPRVLFFFVHRHDFGTYYPSDEAGSHKMIGEGPRKRYNINVPWENDHCGDADYLALWDHVLIPVAKEFGPDIILISAGLVLFSVLLLITFFSVFPVSSSPQLQFLFLRLFQHFKLWVILLVDVVLVHTDML